MPFRYFRDPLFLACVAIYFVNRWALKPSFDAIFFHGYVNDLLCLPIFGTFVVALTSRLGVRDAAKPPQGWELVVMLLLWSILFEVWMPSHLNWSSLATRDPKDVLCYAAGGFGALVFWSAYYATPESHVAVPRN